MKLSQQERRTALESFLFAGVEGAALDFCLESCEDTRAARGETLYTPAQFRRCLALVLSGRLRVTRGELLVGELEAGEWFGAAALFNDREEYPATLTALKECRVLFIPQSVVEQLMERWPKIGANYVRYLSGRICFLSDRLNSLSAGSAGDKVRQFLQSRAENSGAVTLSATDVARALGLGRASVYRAFEALEAQGVLRREGKTMFLTTST